MRGRFTNHGPSLEDRIKGFLIGMAIGDALGAPFEGLPPGELSYRLRDPRLEATGGLIEDFHPFGQYPKGTWTDDTGVSLATCRGLSRYREKKGNFTVCLRQAYREWSGSDECRAVGKTLYSSAKYGVTDENSWANGALIRTSPLAAYAVLKGWDGRRTATLAYETARLSHGHPLAVYPAVEMVMALVSIFSGDRAFPVHLDDPGRRIEAFDCLKDEGYLDYRRQRSQPSELIGETSGLFMWKQVFEDCFELGPGRPWTSLPGFEEGILKVVNTCLDRDSAGAVGGALLGAFRGVEAIPEKWRTAVDRADGILELAEELISGPKPKRRSGKMSGRESGDQAPEPETELETERFILPGLPALETFFQEQVIDIVVEPERYERMGIDFPSPIVLHGAPGTGKTFAVEALVRYLGWPIHYVTAQTIGSIYIHDTSQKIGEVFKEAMKHAPAVVVIDEMESFLCRREGSHDYRIEEVGEFLRLIPRAAENRILVVGMTNLLELIDPAMLRRGRFDHVIRVDLPGVESVEAVLKNLLGDRPCLEGLDIRRAAENLAGRPLSDAAFFVREAARLAVKTGKERIDEPCLALAWESLRSGDQTPAKEVTEEEGERVLH